MDEQVAPEQIQTPKGSLERVREGRNRLVAWEEYRDYLNSQRSV